MYTFKLTKTSIVIHQNIFFCLSYNKAEMEMRDDYKNPNILFYIQYLLRPLADSYAIETFKIKNI